MTEEEQLKIQDNYERRMAQYTVNDIVSMTDEEIFTCTNLIVEGQETYGVALNGTYFSSPEEAHQIRCAVVDRALIAHERRGDVIPRPAIYLDIDGTLLDKYQKPAKCLHEFIEYVTSRFVCFWLTTHERDGNTRHLYEYLISHGVEWKTIDLMKNIWPSHWDFMKTDAINFRGDFLWFDDQPTTGELEVLEKYGASESIVMMDREKGDGLCRWLEKQK